MAEHICGHAIMPLGSRLIEEGQVLRGAAKYVKAGWVVCGGAPPRVPGVNCGGGMLCVRSIYMEWWVWMGRRDGEVGEM